MKFNTIQVLIASTLALGTVAVAQEVSAAEQTTSIYRLYNKNTGEHFYTQSRTEQLNAIIAGWNNEGIGWVAPSYSNSPVYRVYNPHAKGGDHYYTRSKYEAQSLVNQGWKWDGNGKPVFYSGGKASVYVAYNPNAQSGSHNYTPNAFEQQSLLNNGWKFGSTAWNAVTKFNWTLAQYRALTVGDSDGKGGVNYNAIIAAHDIPSDVTIYENGSYSSKNVLYSNSDFNSGVYQYVSLTFVKQANGDYLLSNKSYLSL